MICPRCKQHCRLLKDGKTLSTHRTDMYYIGSNTRERCTYSRSTYEDAINSITPLMRNLFDKGFTLVDGIRMGVNKFH